VIDVDVDNMNPFENHNFILQYIRGNFRSEDGGNPPEEHFFELPHLIVIELDWLLGARLADQWPHEPGHCFLTVLNCLCGLTDHGLDVLNQLVGAIPRGHPAFIQIHERLIEFPQRS
jgi:hypothetical protein